MLSLSEIKSKIQQRRHNRVRAKISGTKEKPRLSVFRSNQHIYAQLVNDENSQTLVEANDLKIKKDKLTKTVIAEKVGELIAAKALEAKIDQVVFDRGGHKYHGRIKALADGARKGGLKF